MDSLDGNVLDHLSLKVSDVSGARSFYERALEPLGISVLMDFGSVLGMGAGQRPQFWIAAGDPGAPVHVAFAADSTALVDAFHAAALAAGGRDNGAPGLREIYHPRYYGAYALDPDGNNVEAVCHRG